MGESDEHHDRKHHSDSDEDPHKNQHQKGPQIKDAASEDADLGIDLSRLKKIDWRWALIIVFLIVGWSWRSYHMDFPSIGYHNMKENEYLSQALNQYNHGDYLRRQMHILGLDDGPGYFEEYPQMPIIPWMIELSWRVFGIHFWSARVIMILFSLGSVVMIYLLAQRLTKSDYISLLSAFLMAYLPLNIFFGRNIQPESPALFFMLLASVLYLRWLDDMSVKNSIWLGLAIALTGIFKYTFLIIMIPWLGFFPYRALLKKDFWLTTSRPLLALLAGLSPLLLWTALAPLLNTKQAVFEATFSRVNLWRIFTPDYWNQFSDIMRSYITDNYTMWFVWFFIIGIILVLFKYRTKLGRFLLLYVLAIIPYAMVLADFIKGHNYYQMPFLPLVILASAYALYVMGKFLAQGSRWKLAIFIPLILIPLSHAQVQASLDRQYGVIFYGLDVAADYIHANSNTSERFWVATFNPQSYGVCFLADRRCAGLVNNETQFMHGEDDLNFSWLYIHIQGQGMPSV
ncbi:hypothetical protein COV94_00045, partial [Candidatus Woesearchaeota archaeon CG11_big_fil_rev_8_21_14_0_20_57_5]